MVNEKYNEFLDTINRLVGKEKEKADTAKIVKCVLIVLAILAVAGGIAYAIYRFTCGNCLEDFEDDLDDDYDDEFFEDEEDGAQEEKPAEMEKKESAE